MRIARLAIHNFRGIREGHIDFKKHTVLIGANNSGKSSVIEALALLFGRDRLVKALTEHDFFGTDPQPADRIRFVATIVGFEPNDPERHPLWFGNDGGIPKWYSEEKSEVSAVQTQDHQELCVEVGLGARFNSDSLDVEVIRYFHDDDDATDPFMDEAVKRLPSKILQEFGFFLVGVSRTWDRMVSFGSELFRRVISTVGGIPSDVLRSERDRLRAPDPPLETQGQLGNLIGRVNNEMSKFFSDRPQLKLRLTATDSDSLLQALIPHYQLQGSPALPAGRQGVGLISLQSLMLLLEFGRLRSEQGRNFCMALEEPELHIPPGIQRRVVYRVQGLTTQTIVTTHSPAVAAFYPPTSIRLLQNVGGALKCVPLLNEPLGPTTINAIRKLFRQNRRETIDALMHEIILIPEGRFDFEWLELLVAVTETKEGWDQLGHDKPPFGTLIGTIPTHDASVQLTYTHLQGIHPKIVVLVDGDAAGNAFVASLLALNFPPKSIIQWPNGWSVEHVITWILEAGGDGALAALQTCPGMPTIASFDQFTTMLMTKREDGGVKDDLIVHESIGGVIGDFEPCLLRANNILSGIRTMGHDATQTIPYIQVDPRSTANCAVRVFSL